MQKSILSFETFWYESPDCFKKLTQTIGLFGGAKISSYSPSRQIEGHFDPNIITIISWPHIKNYQDFQRGIREISGLGAQTSVALHSLPQLTNPVKEEEGSMAVYMFNALWYKPDGGEEKYSEYSQAVMPFLKKYGGTIVEGYKPLETEGDFNPHMIFFVRWPSRDVFVQFVTDPDFQKIIPLRKQALQKALLTETRKITKT